MRRRAAITIAAACLVVAEGCDLSYDVVKFDHVEATQYSRDDLLDLVWRTPAPQLVPALTTVNRRDHPFLDRMLIAELRTALEQKGEEERSVALVEALGWCGWGAVEAARAAAAEFAEQDRLHQLAAIGILRRMGDGASAGPLLRLLGANNREVARSARDALMDLFGTVEAAAEPEIVAGSTPWVMRRVAALRAFVLTDAANQPRFELRKSLSTCPPSRRVDMYRILLRSCMLPLEEFPGQVEMGPRVRMGCPRRWMGHAGEDFIFYMVRNYPRYLVGLSSDLIAKSSPEERSTFWRLLADPLGTGDDASKELYGDWIERDFTEDEGFYFLAAFSQRDIELRNAREFELAAACNWEARLDALDWGRCLDEEYIVHTCLKYLARVTGPDGPEFHRPHPWGDPCVVDTAALRKALNRQYEWDRASRRFVPTE